MDSLDVFGTVKAAYRSILDHPRVFLTVATPILILAIVARQVLPGPDTPEIGISHLAISLAAVVVFVYLRLVLALTWHRAVLLGRRDPENLFGLSARFWRFLAYGALYTVVVAVPGFMLGLALSSEAAEGVSAGTMMREHAALFVWTGIAQIAVTVLAVARFGFVFPAASIDRPTSLRTAWRESAGITGPFAAVLLCAVLPFSLVNHGLGYVLQTELAPLAYHAVFAISVVLDYVGFLVLISAVSLVYAWRMKLRPDRVG
ncbi:MAG: hypothetical protein ACM30I_09025 [Gemmatimonas sp.]